jgi:hypothetical protein
MAFTSRSPFYTLPDLHGDPLVEQSHYPDEEILYLRWHGHLMVKEVIQMGEMALSHHEILQYKRVLSDKSDTTGTKPCRGCNTSGCRRPWQLVCAL